jgi:TldD protein
MIISEDILESILNKSMVDGVTYADIKWMSRNHRQITVKNEIVESNTKFATEGIGIKILYNGAYGFAATNDLSMENLDKTLNRAIRVAKASSLTIKNPIVLADEPTHVDQYITPMSTDPDSVNLEDTVSLLIDSTKNANTGDARIKARNAMYRQWKDNMVLYTSEGTRINQTICVTGGSADTLVAQSGDTQRRGIPCSFRGDYGTAGYEYFLNMKVEEVAEENTKEALNLLDAPHCPSIDDATVIIKPAQLMLQTHENGHGFEMDRAFDYEAAFAGTSFIKPHLINKLKFGNELVNWTADATFPGGLGTFGYDHEGVKAQKTPLVREGVFVGYLSSRETAPLLNLPRSSGSARATSYDRMPLIRMTNINMEPGDFTYEEMVEDTKDGYIFDTNVSWSIDDLRLSFQFGCEIGWRVKNGSIVGLIKNPSYTGITPQFWNKTVAVGKDLKLFGTPNCGKGEPEQVMYTGHGSPTCKFEGIRIGVVK